MLVAVVTGANQGIGFEIAAKLAASGAAVVVCGRDSAKAEAAARAVDARVAEAATTATTATVATRPLQLDIVDAASIAAAVAKLTEWFGGDAGGHGVDALVNNAGMAFKGDTFGADEARATMATNVFGTMAVTRAMLPLLRQAAAADGGAGGTRVVNVCSQAGRLAQVAPPLQARFQDPAANDATITALVREFVDAVAAGDYAARGWPRSMYGVSKLAEIAWTYALARELLADGIVVNACCPGYCATSMSSYHGSRTAAEGADTPAWLVLRERGGGGSGSGKPSELTGGFWHDRRLIAW